MNPLLKMTTQETQGIPTELELTESCVEYLTQESARRGVSVDSLVITALERLRRLERPDEKVTLTFTGMDMTRLENIAHNQKISVEVWLMRWIDMGMS
jgi:hypothetical protein